MKVLIACEESQSVTEEFRRKGHEAFSCDILPTSGQHNEWHLHTDVLPLLTQNWDMIIAFPPCTHLACSGARWFKQKIADGRQQQGIDFFTEFTKTKCNKVVIENPIGIMSTHYRKPDQIIQPYQYGDSIKKSTCLWLHGVPKLKPTNIVSCEDDIILSSGKRMSKWYYETSLLPKNKRAIARSKTFKGIAKAMAEQWG